MRPRRFDDERSHLEDFLALVAHEVRTPLTVVVQGDGDAAGSGLGLFISRGLTAGRKGLVHADPTAVRAVTLTREHMETGCEFVFELPLPPADTANSPQGASQSNGSGRR